MVYIVGLLGFIHTFQLIFIVYRHYNFNRSCQLFQMFCWYHSVLSDEPAIFFIQSGLFGHQVTFNSNSFLRVYFGRINFRHNFVSGWVFCWGKWEIALNFSFSWEPRWSSYLCTLFCMKKIEFLCLVQIELNHVFLLIYISFFSWVGVRAPNPKHWISLFREGQILKWT